MILLARGQGQKTCFRFVQSMSQTQIQPAPQWRWWKIPLRIFWILLLATIIGWTLKRIAATMERTSQPAGFGQGMIQGALMPMAFPNLLVGRDLTIYAQNNTGLTYKLGYTAGVNACGALFFGSAFWRWNRWRSKPEVPNPKSE